MREHTNMTKRVLYTVIVAALVAACCPCRFNRKNAAPLIGTHWVLTQLAGKQIDNGANDGNNIFRCTFSADGTLAGTGACNNFSAQYTTTGKGAITIGTIAATRMYCPNLELEQKLFRELDDATHYEIDGKTLLILSNGEIRLVFSAAN